MNGLKNKYFRTDPDEIIIFHRKDLLNGRSPFTALRDPTIRANFNNDLLQHLTMWDYVAITATIDKLQHRHRYGEWRYPPYHYCLTVLVERYVLWLSRHTAEGDVCVEARGKTEDQQLRQSYNNFYQYGNDWIEAEAAQKRLTSSKLKVEPKSGNIAGLQLADLVANPSFKASLARRNNKPLPKNFGGRIAQILEQSKYDRNSHGRLDGWGRKWLP
jgi:hypothetical protein